MPRFSVKRKARVFEWLGGSLVVGCGQLCGAEWSSSSRGSQCWWRGCAPPAALRGCVTCRACSPPQHRVQVKVVTTQISRGPLPLQENQTIILSQGFFRKQKEEGVDRMADREEAANTEEEVAEEKQDVVEEKEGEEEEEDDPLVIDEEKPAEAAPEDVNEADDDENEKEFEPTVRFLQNIFI